MGIWLNENHKNSFAAGKSHKIAQSSCEDIMCSIMKIIWERIVLLIETDKVFPSCDRKKQGLLHTQDRTEWMTNTISAVLVTTSRKFCLDL